MGSRLEVQLRLQKRGVCEVRVRIRGLFQRRPRGLGIPGLEVSQRELVVSLRESGLELQDVLELRDRLGRLALGEMHLATQEMPFEVRWAFLEDGVERFEALVVLPFAQGNLGQAPPRREEIRGLLGHFRQDSFPLLGLHEGKVKVGQLEPRL